MSGFFFFFNPKLVTIEAEYNTALFKGYTPHSAQAASVKAANSPSIHSLSIPLIRQGRREAEDNPGWRQAWGTVHPGKVANLLQG